MTEIAIATKLCLYVLGALCVLIVALIAVISQARPGTPPDWAFNEEECAALNRDTLRKIIEINTRNENTT